jgi:rSAM/selenodomain-associated transferase 1
MSPESPPEDRVLGIFAKAPIPGKVKTRTHKVLSPEAAAELQRALILDTLAMTRGAPARRILFGAEGDPDGFLAEAASKEGVELLPQVGEDLGARMAAALTSGGVTRGAAMCLIGTDSPHLPPGLIARAFEALSLAEAVIGPAADFGYYLIGAKGAVPPIFEGVAWGTSAVLPETLKRLSGRRYSLLPFWYDIDLPEDLSMLLAHLPTLRRESPSVCLFTEAALAKSLLPSRGEIG